MQPQYRQVTTCLGCLLLLIFNAAIAQDISPTAQQLFQQASNAADLQQKVRLLETALKLSPKYAAARFELAKTLIDMQRYHPAISHLDSTLNDNRENAMVWFYKGVAHQKLEEHQSALKCFERAIKFRNDFPAFYLYRGKAYYANQALEQALKSFDQAIVLAVAKRDQTVEAEAWYGKARTYHDQSDTANAAKAYRQTLKLKPDFKEAEKYLSSIDAVNDLEVWYGEAEAALRWGDLRIAEASYKKVLAVEPAYKDAARKLGIIQNKIMESEIGEQRETENEPPDSAAATPSAPARPIVISQQDSASARDITSTLSRIAPRDDSGSNEPDSSVAGQTAPAWPFEWIAAGGATFLLIVFSLLLFQKQRKKLQARASPKIAQRPHPTSAEKLQAAANRAEFKKATPLTEVPHLKSDRYRLERELGRGGMGRVYKAYDLKLERVVALKLIRLDNALDGREVEERIARFRREAKATAKLNHPNIVSLYDYDEVDGMLYMTVEYVEGPSVEQMLSARKRLAIPEVVRIIKQTCLALDYAHQQQGLIHRDLKPSNLMLNQAGTVKMVDFGVAKMLGSAKSQLHTLTGMRVGSPFYMSPEQIEAKEVDGRTDIYSLGAVFYEMLAGVRPFKTKEGESLSSLFYAILNLDPPGLTTLRPDVPLGLAKIVEKMMAKDRTQRYEKAREIIEALSAQLPRS